MADNAHPPTFGRYRLLSLLGAGGYARVYRAEELDGAMRLVALKVARDCGEGRTRKVVRALTNEARIMLRLHQENLVEVFEFGQVDGRYFIALELVVGLTLKEMLKRAKRRNIFFGPAATILITRGIAAGLHHAHKLHDEDGTVHPVVHRDLKPGNVMVTRDGRVKVMDFGVAKWPLAEVSTTAGIIKGTPLYMAPEQVRAKPVTPQSDIFSLGAVLYQMLTNRPLFQANSIREVLRRVATADIAAQLLWIPEDSWPLVAVLKRALQRDSADRFATASAMIEALDVAAEQVDDDGDLLTLARAVFGREAMVDDEAPTIMPSSVRTTGGNWSIRLKQKDVLVEYDGTPLPGGEKPPGDRPVE